MCIIQSKPGFEFLCRIGLSVALTNNLEHLIQCVEDGLEPCENMDALFEDSQVVGKTTPDGFVPKIDELLQDILEV